VNQQSQVRKLDELKREALEIYLLTGSYQKVAAELDVPTFQVFKWAREDRWDQLFKEHEARLRRKAVHELAQQRIDLAKYAIERLKTMLEVDLEHVRAESLDEVWTAFQKGVETVERLISFIVEKEDELNQYPEAEVVEVPKEFKDLYFQVLDEIESVEP